MEPLKQAVPMKANSDEKRVYFPYYRYPVFDVTAQPHSGNAPRYWINNDGVMDLFLKSRCMNPGHFDPLSFAKAIFSQFNFGVDVLNILGIWENIKMYFFEFILRPEMLPVIRRVVQILDHSTGYYPGFNKSKANEFTLKLLKDGVIPAQWSGDATDMLNASEALGAVRSKNLAPILLSEINTGKVYSFRSECEFADIQNSGAVYKISPDRIDDLHAYFGKRVANRLGSFSAWQVGSEFTLFLLRHVQFDPSAVRVYARFLTVDHLNGALEAKHHSNIIIEEIIMALRENGEDFSLFNFQKLVGSKPELRALFFRHSLIDEPTFNLFLHFHYIASGKVPASKEDLKLCAYYVDQGAKINHKAVQKMALKCSNEALLHGLVDFGLDATGALLAGSLGGAVTLWSDSFRKGSLAAIFKTLLTCEQRHMDDLPAFMFSLLESFAISHDIAPEAFRSFEFFFDRYVSEEMCLSKRSRLVLAWRQCMVLGLMPVLSHDDSTVVPAEIIAILKQKMIHITAQ